MTESINQRIRRLREARGMSQQELAEKSGYSDRSTINKIEKGSRDIKLDRISAIAKALGVSAAYLMGWDEPIGYTENSIEGRIMLAVRNSKTNLPLLANAIDYDGDLFLFIHGIDARGIGADDETLIKIASALHTDINYLLYGLSVLGFAPLPSTKEIPLLGTIACGEPIMATENIDMYIKVDERIPADFALKCKGDSMINARIFDGDVVYIRQQPDVDDGEIAAVLIGEEATLKKVHKYPNKLVLSPCNPMYDDLIYLNEQLEEIRIIGKAVAFTSLIRQ